MAITPRRRLVTYTGIIFKHRKIKHQLGPLYHLRDDLKNRYVASLAKQLEPVLGGLYSYFPKWHVEQYIRLYVSVSGRIAICTTLLSPSQLLPEGSRVFAACQCRQWRISAPHHSSLHQATGPCCCRCERIPQPEFPRTWSRGSRE